MSRAVILLMIMVAWLALVFAGKKERMQYISENLPTLAPNQPIGANSDTLFFSGWSTAEPTHRGSNSRHPVICFRPQPASAADSGSFVIALDVGAIEPLTGKNLRVRINDRSYDSPIATGRSHVFNYVKPASSSSDLICLRFDVPLTVKDLWDFRGLGLLFKSLRYSYEMPQPEVLQ